MVSWQSTTPAEIGAYIREQAQLRGIDPTIAWRVANGEGLNTPVGDYGQSFGPYQLFMGGGLGNSFLTETGLHPSNYEQNWQQQVQWFLNWATKYGWNPGGVLTGPNSATGGGSHAATVMGIGNWQGLSGSVSLPIDLTNRGVTDTAPPVAVTGGSSGSLGDSTGIGSQVTTQVGGGGSAPTTTLKLNFADTVQHSIAQVLLILLAIALLLGGIYLVAK
jgi:hypothetical protein